MQLNKLGEKSRGILKALAKGHSCEQILASDPRLTFHDIFRAATESPTSIWKKKSATEQPPPEGGVRVG